MKTPAEILKENWGYDTFRGLQLPIIEAVLQGKDVLALLPTGGGKSICFQVPALAKEGICIVVSPLIALIKDQVENLNRRGIPALAIHAGMRFPEIKRTLENAVHGNFKFLYVSPERLKTDLFLEYLPGLVVNLIAVDEAHCISQWGYDFRPAYLQIAELRQHLPDVPLVALTASATLQVQNDICDKLQFGKDSKKFQQSFSRPNLSYSVFGNVAKENKLLSILKNVPGTSIVYCKSRKRTIRIAELLKLNGLAADYYHAGLHHDQRNEKQQAWIDNKIRVIVCTNAFGMGIDKPDVRTVIHYDAPDSLENYYQEAGRAGRDGLRSYAVLLYDDAELADKVLQLETRYPDPDSLKKIYQSLMNHLQVAAGAGEGQSFDFDITAFAKQFNLNLLQATYTIKFFEQQGFLTVNEVFYRPSTALVVANRVELERVEKEAPMADLVLKGLLRSYEGIHSFPVNIFEKALARFVKISEEQTREQLAWLHVHGVIEYTSASEKPFIYLLQNRMYKDAFTINYEQLRFLKQQAANRLAAFNNYISNVSNCRSQTIADYFSDKIGICGICDNCLAKYQHQFKPGEFKVLADALLVTIKANVKSKQSYLIEKFKTYPKTKVLQVLQFLMEQDRISQQEDWILIK